MKNWYLVMKNKLNGPRRGNVGMNVLNNWLYVNDQAVKEVPCSVPKYDENKENNVQYIIHHYTASTTAQSAHDSYKDPATQASWHLTIDRDGTVYQLLGFDKVAWHAGESAWGNLKYLNPVSIGIEHVSAGPLTIKNGSYSAWDGQAISVKDVYFDVNAAPWMNFTPIQAQASIQVTLFLANYFKVRDILGHNQICVPPGRKLDPGPAWQPTLQYIRKQYGLTV